MEEEDIQVITQVEKITNWTRLKALTDANLEKLSEDNGLPTIVFNDLVAVKTMYSIWLRLDKTKQKEWSKYVTKAS